MASKHTPGPWTVGLKSQFETLNPNIIFAEDGGSSVCSVYEVPLHTSLEDLLRSGNHHDAIGLANARLIAAAPELLEACKRAIHLCEDGGSLWEQLDKAISKAEGR